MNKIYALLLFVMLLWGLNLSALKVLVTNIDPVFLTAIRIGTAGVAVLIITYFMKIFRLPTRKEIRPILVITIFNVVTHHLFLALGLSHTSGVNTSLILGAGPIVTMVLAILLLKDQITRMRILGFVLGFIGIAVTSLSGSSASTFSIGDVYVFISMATQAYSFILIRKLNPNLDPRLMTGYMLVLGASGIFIASLMMGSDLTQITLLFDWKLGAIFLFSALLCTAFGHMVYNYAIKYVGPAETTIFINLNTVFALVGAAVFLGESISVNHIAGLVLIFLGVFIGSGTLEYLIRKRRERI